MGRRPSRAARRLLRIFSQDMLETQAPNRLLEPVERATHEYAESFIVKQAWEKRLTDWRARAQLQTAPWWAAKESLKPSQRRLLSKSSIQSFRRQFRLLQKRIPTSLMDPSALQLTQQRLRLLKRRMTLIEILVREGTAGKQRKVRRTFRVFPQRFEKLSRVLSKFGDFQSFAGKDILLGGSPFREQLELSANTPPFELVQRWVNRAGTETLYDRAFYDCRLFIHPDAYREKPHEWGKIIPTPFNPILAIQLFDPNPNTLLNFAKAMAKRAPKEPIVILDLYGNVFYP